MAPVRHNNVGFRRIRRNRVHAPPPSQDRIAALLTDDREDDRVAYRYRTSSRRNHSQVMRTLYLTFSVDDRYPVRHHHLALHFQTYYPYARLRQIQLQRRHPPLCAWVVLQDLEDMVEVLGPELLPVEDVTDLHQSLWIRPQRCNCALCL